MTKYTKTTVKNNQRTELHELLSLTGAEISINTLAAASSVPFIHAHQQNEEIYGILEGSGKFVLDNESIQLKKGDWVRISPETKRQLFADEQQDLVYLCIQVKENSLSQWTGNDGIIY